jgi:hypothetical protein
MMKIISIAANAMLFVVAAVATVTMLAMPNVAAIGAGTGRMMDLSAFMMLCTAFMMLCAAFSCECWNCEKNESRSRKSREKFFHNLGPWCRK